MRIIFLILKDEGSFDILGWGRGEVFRHVWLNSSSLILGLIVSLHQFPLNFDFTIKLHVKLVLLAFVLLPFQQYLRY